MDFPLHLLLVNLEPRPIDLVLFQVGQLRNQAKCLHVLSPRGTRISTINFPHLPASPVTVQLVVKDSEYLNIWNSHFIHLNGYLIAKETPGKSVSASNWTTFSG